MKLGVLTVRLRLHGPRSLKDKRSLLKGWVAQLRHQYNVSIAEIAQQDDKRAATLAVAHLASDGQFVHHVLSKVALYFEGRSDCNVEDVELEVW